jgi:hypothetical protein
MVGIFELFWAIAIDMMLLAMGVTACVAAVIDDGVVGVTLGLVGTKRDDDEVDNWIVQLFLGDGVTVMGFFDCADLTGE